MAGIRSIGWWLPQERLSAAQLAIRMQVAPEAFAKVGLLSVAVPGDDDHPSTMGARATRAALSGAGLDIDDLDLLIFAGVTKDWPAPWVAAFGVLHGLGATRAGGIDVSNRCASIIDALWLAKVLVESGTHRVVAVCCAERFDHLFSPSIDQASFERVTDGMYAAGAATAIVTADADNRIAAFSSYTNPDLSIHHCMAPIAGGSLRPLDEGAVREGLHFFHAQLSMRDVDQIAKYSAAADRNNYHRILHRAGIDGVDFIACSPFYVEPQMAVLEELRVAHAVQLLTIPRLGHVGPADLLLILGIGIANGFNVGRRIVFSTRTPPYSNALAIVSASQHGIAVAGEGIDLSLWPAPRAAHVHRPGSAIEQLLQEPR
jgi:3-oxoacyl-[acyl-carrier-protein] synthase-3